MSDEINRLRDRVKDLEDRLHERDLAVATLAQQLSERDTALDEAYKAHEAYKAAKAALDAAEREVRGE